MEQREVFKGRVSGNGCTFSIYDLEGNTQYSFLESSDRKEALVTVYLLETNRRLSVNDERVRTAATACIKEGKLSYRLGKFCVLTKEYEDKMREVGKTKLWEE